VSGSEAVCGAAGDGCGWSVGLGRDDSRGPVFYFSRHESMLA
jgi:hypothetical protein